MEKLNCESLMIGDWVYDGNSIAQVTSITCDGIIETTHNQSSNIELIQPIPLTVEILEKNGFVKDEKKDNMYYWNWGVIDDCISYDKETSKVRIFYVSGLTFVKILQYVHELQHALRLCGIEKQIML